MKYLKRSRSETRFIIIIFIILAVLTSVSQLFGLYQLRIMNGMTNAMYQKLSIIIILLGSFLLAFYVFLSYLTIRRISNYTAKNDHLTSVLSVIREINQLIVRAKERKLLIEESCKILVSNYVYANALIVLYYDEQCIEYLASADTSDDFTAFNTKEAFSIQLKYNNKLYGNMSLSVNEAYIYDKEEMSLLEEVAGDISYALYNFETQEHLSEQEESLLYFKELYENIIDSVDNIIFVKDINFTYTVCNQAFEKFVGKANHEIIGKTDYEIFDKEVADFFRSHDIKMFEEKKSKSNFEWVTYPDGRHVYLFTVKSPLLNSDGKILGLVGNSADVTEQRIAEEALTQKKKELETILQEAPNPIMLHNEAGEVLMVNQVWKSLSGYTFEDIDTVEKWAEQACAKDKPLMHEFMDKLYSLEHTIDMGEASVTTKEGNTLIWQFSSAPLGIIDGKRTVVTTAMDITELKRKDQMMMAQSRHAAMGEMIGMIAHQWRQPISGIAMNANNILLDIALETFDTASATVYAQDILDQTQHLSKTIDDFRNFFKPDKSVSSVNLREIIEETFTIVKDSLMNNGIQIKTTYLSETKVDAYSRELMQVFVNLINNAKDALISRETKDPLIDICVYEDELYLNTTFCDNGGGIDEAILPKLFDPYFTTKDEKTGTGLGLYMSKMIIEDHLHGVIEGYNSNDGACFKVKLLKNSPKNEILNDTTPL